MTSAIASTGVATMPKISARGSAATHSVNGVGRGSSEFAAMGRSPIGSPRTLNVDVILLIFAIVRRVMLARPGHPAIGRREQEDRVERGGVEKGHRRGSVGLQLHAGCVMRQIRRAMIAADGRPVFTRDLLRWAYPQLERFQCWHYWSVYRAVKRYGIRVGRAWAPNAELRRLICGDYAFAKPLHMNDKMAALYR